MTLKIIDVSAWQPTYKFGQTKEDGLIVKATEGTDYINPQMKSQLKSVIDNGLFGVYHFATLTSTPEKQAKFFYQSCKEYFNSKNCIAVLDYETNYLQSGEFVKRFITAFKKLGGKTIWLYGGQYLAIQSKQLNVPFWLAYYPYATTALSPQSWEAPQFNIKIDGTVSMWQYTTGNDKLDRSLFYGDDKTWQKLSVKGV